MRPVSLVQGDAVLPAEQIFSSRRGAGAGGLSHVFKTQPSMTPSLFNSSM